jgi:hypothetical protein
VAEFSERSGRVIRTCESGFSEEDLGSGESFEDVHGALAERTRPGSRLAQGRCLGCWQRLVEQKTAEWQQVLDHSGVVQGFVTGALSILQLARAQVLMHDEEAARKSYEDFLTLWKSADPDLPIYREAKAEYATLRKTAQ